jgi:diguanylate cyclase (GGDEF)-like protein
MAILRGCWDVERYIADRSEKSHHLAWAVGSAGLLSAGLFLILKRARRLPLMSRFSSRAVPPTPATYDSVTGLPTKRLFVTLVNQAVSRAKKGGLQVAILMVELDYFALEEDSRKPLHDGLLYRVQAARLKSALRTTDTVARLGDRSFAALIENIADGSSVAAVAAKMQAMVSLPFVLEGRELFLTSRIGIAVSSSETKHGTDLLEMAARAVSQARTEGCVVHGLPNTGTAPALDPLTGVPSE